MCSKIDKLQDGPQLCLGKELACRQMMIFAAVPLHFFIFKLADENRKNSAPCAFCRWKIGST
ncbi:hypothetical protein EJ110_NYTH50707 [Nymphaea thermarum]|nr:hypothetical protein EJ110_NYTH50707 [Nymphaea thermarum]